MLVTERTDVDMTKRIVLIVLALTFQRALSQQIVATCAISKNEECYSEDGVHYNTLITTCDREHMIASHKALNEAYHQNLTVPNTVDKFECVNIKTAFILIDNVTDYFTYKGCVEHGFDLQKVEPNSSYIREERREIFETCDNRQCNDNHIIITPRPRLSCFSCNGEAECQKENLKTVNCKDNYVDTYRNLTKHYGIDYRPNHNLDYRCFSIDSNLTGQSEISRMIYKGCIEEGFDACNLNFNREKYNKDSKQNCKSCRGDLCNTRKVANPLSCYFCNGTTECKEENLKTVNCENNYFDTYEMLSEHYDVKYQPTHEEEYECFSIASNLTGPSHGSEMRYKGCIERGFKACSLAFNKVKYNKEEKEHCKTCSKELCNKNSAYSVMINFWVLILTVVTMITAF